MPTSDFADAVRQRMAQWSDTLLTQGCFPAILIGRRPSTDGTGATCVIWQDGNSAKDVRALLEDILARLG